MCFVYVVSISVCHDGRASGAEQGSPVSRKQGAKLAVFSFPFLIQAIAQPVE